VRRAASLLAWFALLVGLWLLLVGTRQHTEVYAGLIAAALGAGFAEILRSRGLLAYRTDPRTLVKLLNVPWQIVFDFLVLTWVLVRSVARGRRVEGVWLTVPYPTAPGEQGRWQRAFATTTGTATPNAIVVDLDRGEALLHALEPGVKTGHEVI
jgi:multisubunit Na+/H+ antiporter MnhE subunit